MKPRGLARIVPTIEGLTAGRSLAEPLTERVCRDCAQVFSTVYRAKFVCDSCVDRYRAFGPFAARSEVAEAELDRRLGVAGIYGRLKEKARLETFRASEQPTAFEAAQRFLDAWPKQLGLALVGGVGSGKTHLTVAIARRLLQRGHEVRYVHLPTMAWKIKTAESWSREAGAQTAPLYAADLVVLDDVGREKETPTLKEAMDALINDRWVRERPTLIATNLSAELLQTWLGEASASRFRSEAVVITMADGDRRLHPVDDDDQF